MSRYSNKKTVSPETKSDAMKNAKSTQRPGQTKEQTRFIAQGIQKGIEQYKNNIKRNRVNWTRSLRLLNLKTAQRMRLKSCSRRSIGNIGCPGYC